MKCLISILTFIDPKWMRRYNAYDCRECFYITYSDWSLLEVLFK